MGLLGGSSQSTSSLISTINFDPVLQFGSQQTASTKKEQTQTAVTTPKLDESMTASVGVGVAGGSGSGGAVQRSTDDSLAVPTTLGTAEQLTQQQNLLVYGGIALAVGGAVYFLTKKKKKG